MYKIAIMGESDSIYGFATLGLDTYPVDNPENAQRTLRNLAESNYAVVYVTESTASGIQNEIDRYSEEKLPAIILLPGVSGNTGDGVRNVSKSVEQAVGSDIIFGGDKE